MPNRLARPRILGPGRLEEPKDVLRTGGGPQREETVIRISESPTTADRHEPRIAHLRENHAPHSFPRPSAPLAALSPGTKSAAWRREWSRALISRATRLPPPVTGG